MINALDRLSAYEDVGLLLLRLVFGSFLVWGVSDNLFVPSDMAVFVTFLQANGFPMPELMAWLTVAAQFICGVLLIGGLLFRWAALIMVINFLVALVMVHLGDDFRGMFPVLALIFVNLHFMLRGAGSFALDALIFNTDNSA